MSWTGLQPLGAACRRKRNPLTFRQGLETRALDGGMMDKNVLSAIFRRDKAKSLGVVEPFYCTSCHNTLPYSLKTAMCQTSS